MEFYICIDYSGCARPEILETSMSNSDDLRGEWFKRMIYVKNIGCGDFLSIAQKNDLVWGGYVSRYQLKPLIVKRVL